MRQAPRKSAWGGTCCRPSGYWPGVAAEWAGHSGANDVHSKPKFTSPVFIWIIVILHVVHLCGARHRLSTTCQTVLSQLCNLEMGKLCRAEKHVDLDQCLLSCCLNVKVHSENGSVNVLNNIPRTKLCLYHCHVPKSPHGAAMPALVCRDPCFYSCIRGTFFSSDQKI